MSPKFYAWLWIVFLTAIAVVWLTGSLSMFALVAVGFIAFGMIFMGMMCVLPAAVGPHAPVRAASERGVIRRSLTSMRGRIHAIFGRWSTTPGVEIRQPRFP